MSRSTLPPVEDEFTRALLRSAEADEPSKLAYAKAAAELGLGVGVGVGLGVGASVSPTALAAGAAALTSAARWSSSTLARFVAFGVSGVLLVGGVTYLLARSTATQPPAPSVKHGLMANARSAPAALAVRAVQRAQSHVAARAAAEPSVPPQPAATASAGLQHAGPLLGARPSEIQNRRRTTLGVERGSALAKAHAAPSHRVSPASSAALSPATGSSLAEQVQSLDRARVALGSGNPSAALREISFYRGAWPNGVFLTEASVLEIEALAARGERSLAGLRARAFVAAHPDSPQADRLRALIPVEQR